LVQQQKLPEDPEREKKLIKLRDDMGHFRPLKLSPIERGWSGTKMPGRSIGPPDPVGEGRHIGFFSVIYFDPVCMNSFLLPGSFPLNFISILDLEVSRVSKYSNIILMCLFEMKDFDNEYQVEFVVLMKHFLFAETFEGFDTKVLEVSNVTLLCGCKTTCTFFED